MFSSDSGVHTDSGEKEDAIRRILRDFEARLRLELDVAPGSLSELEESSERLGESVKQLVSREVIRRLRRCSAFGGSGRDPRPS
jgi:hypothetical protein